MATPDYLRILPGPAFTKEGYESLVEREVIYAMAAVPEAIVSDPDSREKVRKWGLVNFPDFQLSAKQVREAVKAAASIRKSRVT